MLYLAFPRVLTFRLIQFLTDTGSKTLNIVYPDVLLNLYYYLILLLEDRTGQK